MYGTCQLKLFFAFHLVGFLSIQLFICISAGGCANSCHESLCVFVWKKCQSTETQTACSVKSCGRNAQTPIRGGLCRRTQTEMKAKNGCAAFQLPGFVTVWVLALKGRNWVINCPVGNLLKKKKKKITRDMERKTIRRNLLRPAAALISFVFSVLKKKKKNGGTY